MRWGREGKRVPGREWSQELLVPDWGLGERLDTCKIFYPDFLPSPCLIFIPELVREIKSVVGGSDFAVRGILQFPKGLVGVTVSPELLHRATVSSVLGYTFCCGQNACRPR